MLASFMTTVPGTLFPFVSLTVNVSRLTVAGSIGWLKVAVTAGPVTTLLLVFVLVGTVVALGLGLDEITVGSVAAPTRVPGATVTPGATTAGSTAATALPIPPPASNAANRKAINIDGLYKLLKLIIFSSFVFISPQGTRWGLDDPVLKLGGDFNSILRPSQRRNWSTLPLWQLSYQSQLVARPAPNPFQVQR